MSQPSKIHTLATKDTPGSVTRMFRVRCGICSNCVIRDANSFEEFANSIGDLFHLSVENGWVHHACQKRLPLVIKTSR